MEVSPRPKAPRCFRKRHMLCRSLELLTPLRLSLSIMSDVKKPACISQGQGSLDRGGKPAQPQRGSSKPAYVPPHLRAARNRSVPTHKAVIVLLVTPPYAGPQESYDAVQRLRSQHDAAFARWVPHVTLVPPFDLPLARQSAAESHSPSSFDSNAAKAAVASSSIDEVASARSLIKQKLQGSLSQHSPFRLEFADHDRFNLRSYTNLHLRPAHNSSNSGRKELTNLHACIQTALDGIVTPERRAYQPHLTIGQASSKDGMELVASSVKALSESNGPLTMHVKSVALMGKRKEDKGAYQVWEVVKLGQASEEDEGM